MAETYEVALPPTAIETIEQGNALVQRLKQIKDDLAAYDAEHFQPTLDRRKGFLAYRRRVDAAMSAVKTALGALRLEAERERAIVAQAQITEVIETGSSTLVVPDKAPVATTTILEVTVVDAEQIPHHLREIRPKMAEIKKVFREGGTVPGCTAEKVQRVVAR